MDKPYGAVNLKTGEVYINKAKNRSGLQYLDTSIHESVHFHNPKLSEEEVINKTTNLRNSIMGII